MVCNRLICLKKINSPLLFFAFRKISISKYGIFISTDQLFSTKIFTPEYQIPFHEKIFAILIGDFAICLYTCCSYENSKLCCLSLYPLIKSTKKSSFPIVSFGEFFPDFRRFFIIHHRRNINPSIVIRTLLLLKSGFSALPLLGLSSIKSLAMVRFSKFHHLKFHQSWCFSTLTMLMVFR